jgi:lipopolysaccharide transport system ATP-binding protein
VLFVSHDMGAIRSLCKKAIYLERGLVKMIGEAPVVAEQYIRAMREEMSNDVRQFARVSSGFIGKHNSVEVKSAPSVTNTTTFKQSDEFDKQMEAHRYGSGGARVSYVELVDKNDNSIEVVEFNQEVKIRIYVYSKNNQPISINFNVRDDKKINLVGCGFAQVAQEHLDAEEGGRYVAEYTLKLPLQEGSYSIRVQISSPITPGITADFLDVVEDAVVFRVERWAQAPVWSKVHLFPGFQLNKIE